MKVDARSTGWTVDLASGSSAVHCGLRLERCKYKGRSVVRRWVSLCRSPSARRASIAGRASEVENTRVETTRDERESGSTHDHRKKSLVLHFRLPTVCGLHLHSSVTCSTLVAGKAPPARAQRPAQRTAALFYFSIFVFSSHRPRTPPRPRAPRTGHRAPRHQHPARDHRAGARTIVNCATTHITLFRLRAALRQAYLRETWSPSCRRRC